MQGALAVRLERRVLSEDRRLELPQLRARLESELVCQHATRVAVGLERVRLSARAVQRQHELRAKPLAVRMLGHEHLQLGHQLGLTPELEVGVDPLLERL